LKRGERNVTLIEMSFIQTFMEIGVVKYENQAKQLKSFEMEEVRLQ
jgi:hypothetical protein